MQPGEELKGSERPYFKTYINRKAIPYRSDSANKTYYTEQSLAGLLSQGNNVLLIGNPTEGKTRTLFEVIKKLNGFLVISLPTDKALSVKALQLLKEKKVIWLFDDLNSHESNAYDFQYTFNQIKAITRLCVLAATCKDGPELKKSIEDKAGQLQKIYYLFDCKLTLESVEDDQKEVLKKALNETESRLFPTLGSICMRKHFEYMHDRFDDMPVLDQNSLRSIALLFSGNISPFTLQRIMSVLTDIFGHEKNNVDEPKVRASLNNLAANGFIISPKDVFPIVPEAAYLTEPERKFYYPESYDIESNKLALVNCLKEQNDTDGLQKLAASYYFSDDINTALKIFELIINEFKGSNDNTILKQVAIALFRRGLIFDKLDQSEKAIQCYDDLIKQFGNSQELVLQKHVAHGLFNKGLAHALLCQYEKAIQCYDDLIKRFGNSQELVLQKLVDKARTNKKIVDPHFWFPFW